MTTPTNDITEKAIALIVLGVTGAERFWVEWASWFVDASYSVAGLVLVCVLIYKHILSIKKDRLEIKSNKEE